jgi:phosphoglycolate phosphatase
VVIGFIVDSNYQHVLAWARGFADPVLAAIRSAGHRTVLTTSAKPGEVRHYLDLLDADELVDATATGGDVEGTKPQPDLMHAAVAALPAVDAHLVIGDAVWDVVAAYRADLPAVGVLTGGFGEAELRDTGAVEVFEGPHAMAGDLASAVAHAGGDRRAARS